MLYYAVRRFTDWVHAAYLSALPFLGALFNVVVSVCLGNAKEKGKVKVPWFSSIYGKAVAKQSGSVGLSYFW